MISYKSNNKIRLHLFPSCRWRLDLRKQQTGLVFNKTLYLKKLKLIPFIFNSIGINNLNPKEIFSNVDETTFLCSNHVWSIYF